MVHLQMVLLFINFHFDTHTPLKNQEPDVIFIRILATSHVKVSFCQLHNAHNIPEFPQLNNICITLGLR